MSPGVLTGISFLGCDHGGSGRLEVECWYQRGCLGWVCFGCFLTWSDLYRYPIPCYAAVATADDVEIIFSQVD